MTSVARALAFSAALLLAVPAFAQGTGPGGWPNKPVKIIVPFAPAGPTDIAARLVAQKMSDNLKQQFYIENQAGAGGNLGMGNAAKSAPDGDTIQCVSSSYVVNPSLYDKVPYDPYKDFIPLTVAATAANVLLVNPAVLPVKTPKELAAYIYQEVVKAVKAPDVTAKMEQLGLEIICNTPEEFTRQIKFEIDKWGKVIREANIKVQ
jgi:tripartite-type tricarboxylate transporter receptor subunit TctC